MLLLARRGDRLEVVDANDTAHALLDNGARSVVGRYLDRVLTQPTAVRGVTQTMLRGQPRRLARPARDHPPPREPGRGRDLPAHGRRRRRGRRDVRRPAARRDAAAPVAGPHPGRRAAHERAARHGPLHHDHDRHGRHGGPRQPGDHPADRVHRGRSCSASRCGPGSSRPPRSRTPARCSTARTASCCPGSRESDLRTATGDPLRVLWNTDLVRDEEDGTPQYAVLTGVDVTAERAGAGLMANLFQAGISTAIIGIDAQGSIRVLNSGAETLLGLRLRGAAGPPVRRRPRPRGAARPHRRVGRHRLERPHVDARRRQRVGRARLDLADRPGAAPYGRDDDLRRRQPVRAAGRVRRRGPRRHRAAAGAADADDRAGEGAGRGRPAAPARLREERVRLHGQPRAAHAGHQHRRLHRDARRRRARAGPTRSSCRCWRRSRATAPG